MTDGHISMMAVLKKKKNTGCNFFHLALFWTPLVGTKTTKKTSAHVETLESNGCHFGVSAHFKAVQTSSF